MEADSITTVVLPLALFIIMLGMGMSLTLKDFSNVLTQPKSILIGVLVQMVLLPLLAFVVLKIFGMTGALAVGFMLLALCPGGTTSNLYTYLAKGDVALSVSLTSVVSVIAPFTVPLMIVFFMNLLMDESTAISLPIIDTIIQLIAITVLPITIGMTIKHLKPAFSVNAEKSVKVFSMVFLVLVVGGIVGNNIEHMASYFMKAGFAAVALNILCLMLGYLIATMLGLNQAQSKAIGIEVGFQNGTLAIVIALSLLENTEMAIPATMYSLIMFVTGFVFILLVKTKPKVSQL